MILDILAYGNAFNVWDSKFQRTMEKVVEVRPDIMKSAHESIDFRRGMEGWLGKPRRLRSRHSYPVLGSSGSAISVFDSVLGLGARTLGRGLFKQRFDKGSWLGLGLARSLGSSISVHISDIYSIFE